MNDLVGKNVEWVKPRPSYRDWYGTIVEVTEDKVKVEWIIEPGQTKFKWEPWHSVNLIDSIPEVLPVSRRNARKFLEDVDLPASYQGWYLDAKCHGTNNPLFVGYGTPRPNARTRKLLEAACDGCPVMIVCRGEALRTESVGWWGGMDEPDRLAWAKTLSKKEK